MDYLINPVEHIVGVEPLPSWDLYVTRIVEVDAELRLAGLQAWIGGPQEGEVLTRLAKAGQAYDPFTGLPMLVNQRKGLIYSVGRDGKDQEGDSTRDLAVPIPFVSSSDSRRAPLSPPPDKHGMSAARFTPVRPFPAWGRRMCLTGSGVFHKIHRSRSTSGGMP